MTIILKNTAPPVSELDLDSVEAALNKELSQQFRLHYLMYNGGNPERKLFRREEECDPYEVVAFYPIKYKTTVFDTDESLLVGHYFYLLAKNVIPNNLLPFAHDPGGNLFCIHLENQRIYFYATDSFSPDRNVEENKNYAMTKISDDFQWFLDNLELNAEYSGDEWPEY